MRAAASEFDAKFLTGGSYRSPGFRPGLFTRIFPSLSFYGRLFGGPVFRLCRLAAKGLCDDSAWTRASVEVAELVERIGGKIVVEGMEAITAVDGPCLFVANHMSTLETFMLPGIIRPRRPVTFVVKNSLVAMPFFGMVMRSRDPVVVGRSSPREDLARVLEGGRERLGRGVSIIIFPQSTRSPDFDLRRFNSIGVKLAMYADVPIVPLALKTDAWGQGKAVKELGKIRPELTVRYRFASPLRIAGRGREDHAAICDHIAQSLREWRRTDAALLARNPLS
ncbi:MAG: 1-acyl-sn-glycerol-3-phosphate acyltransferase [Desulfovibrio sp.]|jgi:1-acyl-sn-glycerol-3-phosphate acyltransferase|nr:1-acyl-sn-glycerol-3-phosphate acyltransferase [Desulfovibrio sp.]